MNPGWRKKVNSYELKKEAQDPYRYSSCCFMASGIAVTSWERVTQSLRRMILYISANHRRVCRVNNHTRGIYRYYILDEVLFFRNCQISETAKNKRR